MTPQEFSDSFDVLLRGYIQTGNKDAAVLASYAFDEYEKSVFLTKAQEQLIVELYSGRNTKGSAFEESEELRAGLRSLIKTAILEEDDNSHKGLSKYSKFYILPEDILFITYDTATISDKKAGCKNGTSIQVVPVTQDEFYSISRNPFRGLTENRALRLDNSLSILEVVSKYNLTDYTIRYLSQPNPIITENLIGVSIHNNKEISGCELDPILHMSIVDKAVSLALASRNFQKENN